MSPEAPKENPQRSGQELIDIKKQLSKELIGRHPCVSGIGGPGPGFEGEGESGLRVYLLRAPRNNREIKDLVGAARKVPQDIPIYFNIEGDIDALKF